MLAKAVNVAFLQLVDWTPNLIRHGPLNVYHPTNKFALGKYLASQSSGTIWDSAMQASCNSSLPTALDCTAARWSRKNDQLGRTWTDVKRHFSHPGITTILFGLGLFTKFQVRKKLLFTGTKKNSVMARGWWFSWILSEPTMAKKPQKAVSLDRYVTNRPLWCRRKPSVTSSVSEICTAVRRLNFVTCNTRSTKRQIQLFDETSS
jgi:hypothetical protein